MEEKQLKQIVKPLLEWYQENKRELPWRKTKEPYAVWVSEIMLQQTRIEAVKAYYIRFMEVLPSIEELAKVNEEELLKLWEGLGYYNRARNLKKAAEKIVAEYNGEFPSNYESLLELPGIGVYTAGAIASICFDEKEVAVDGNVLRVLARILGFTKIVDLLEQKKKLSELLKEVLPKETGDFNQAIMELGELICIPAGMPECLKCPLHKVCRAYEKKIQLQIPKKLSKKERRKEEKTILLLVCNEKIALVKRPNTGLLANLYEFPNVSRKLSLSEIEKYLDESDIKCLGESKHIFTHIEWHMIGYLIITSAHHADYIWVTYEELEKQYPLPIAFKFFKNRLRKELK